MSSAASCAIRDDADRRTCAGWAWTGTRGRMSAAPRRPTAQSERGDGLPELFARLESEARAYPCYCTAEDLELSRKLQRMAGKPPRYAGTCRASDRARQRAERGRAGTASPRCDSPCRAGRGRSSSPIWCTGRSDSASADIGDFIVRREDGTSAFFFCNAVDDSVMGVTHVLRGDDHLTNTPRQLMLLDALGMRRPGYGHVGLLVGADGAPLSKRHGSTSVQEFRAARLLAARRCSITCSGWGIPPMSTAGCRCRACPRISGPNISGRASARFEESQLMHWQKETLQRMSTAEIARLARPRRIPRRSSSWCGTMWCCRADARALGGRGARRTAAARRRGAARHRGRRPGFLRRRGRSARSGRARICIALATLLKERTGRKGARAVHAAAGGAHRPDARPGTRSAIQAHAAGDGAPPARIPCSRIITRSPARKRVQAAARQRSAHVRLRHYRVRLHSLSGMRAC